MLNYDYKQLMHIIRFITQKDKFTIVPVGNHELNRHLVYIVNSGDSPAVVVKLYYKSNRRNREVAALRLLSGSSVKCSRMIKYGELDNGTEWSLYEYMEGEVLDKVIDTIPADERLEIFEEMGEELGKIHSIKEFDFYGNWNMEGRSIDNIKSCIVSSIISMEYCVRDIQEQKLPEKDLLNKAIAKMRNSYTILNDIKESRLRHNDYDGRNILVDMEKGRWKLSGVLDFEQSTPGNIETDFISLYHKYFMENSAYEKAFFRGYNRHWKLGAEFYDRLDFYLLCEGISICSWSFEQAQDYYQDGLELIKRYG